MTCIISLCYIMKQTRLDALSDGIFAIVMSILVFEIRIPYFSGSLADKQIFDLLISILPLLINYILSFSLLFTYWRSNHFIASVLAKNIDVHCLCAYSISRFLSRCGDYNLFLQYHNSHLCLNPSHLV